MLTELSVENLLLIERARLRLSPGLNVITGETGAGKTVLAQALDLLLGGRARAGIVRPGAQEAYVEGAFECPQSLRAALGERLPADAAELLLARRVGSDGRSRAYLNGRSISVGELRDLGERVLCFYGQHEHRSLTISAAQLEMLDELCGPEHAREQEACAAAHAEAARLTGELESLRELAAARDREIDLLEHELAEIDSSALGEREHEELLALRERLRRLDSLRAAAGAALQALAPDSFEAQGAVALLAQAAARMEELAGVDPSLDALGERARALAIDCQDLASELREYCERADADGAGAEAAAREMTLEALEDRLATIDRLMRKHGGSLRSVHEHATRARERREQLLGAEVALTRAERRLAQVQAALREHVRAIHRARKRAAPLLVREMSKQLRSLGMGEASFDVRISGREVGPGGADAVEFLIAPNPGVPAGAVREIASGGELSRIMLALSTAALALRARDGDPLEGATLVFDEVDAGVGGHTARAVGARLRELADARQVLCITHLPQIASLGDRHFAIVKDTSAEPTRTSVVQLEEREVVSELVRMLGAETDDVAARRHARGLRRAA